MYLNLDILIQLHLVGLFVRHGCVLHTAHLPCVYICTAGISSKWREPGVMGYTLYTLYMCSSHVYLYVVLSIRSHCRLPSCICICSAY
ncbi:hypothetical protein BDV30DRAFT_189757 [Aspergillus minisclerotigenes]|uniref:Uncharacterized protein n=1 Tax=Aspergillus minisclerotigenes TaxID=656917 RepID=A0A5N6IRJ1_9EURO|nr:hypothetical protein BDV30DRAFT_189757 [Aspergillus minisclerotigenes]